MNSIGHIPHELSSARKQRLAVGSYNLHSCVGLDGRRSPARIADALRELDCDIYALQEVDNQPGEHDESMQLEYLSRAMNMTAVPGLRIVRHTGEYGNAILTRLPIKDIRRHDLSYSWCEPRGAIDIELDLHGQPLRIVATHLGLRRSERRFQWRRLMVAIAEGSMEMPTIVLGDMNEWYRGARTLREAHDAFGEPPAPAAFPSFAPMLALSRIWVRPRAALESLVVHRTDLTRKASDHLPLKATLDVAKLHS
ncbi:MAG TPA: endonuclease/exonuclease/phosphatase family protein [Steroidobacteraceae bacterium]|nr:endonuclease/exonuclease/phosphatase family protein [Steroidobacteraceae bacterium]